MTSPHNDPIAPQTYRCFNCGGVHTENNLPAPCIGVPQPLPPHWPPAIAPHLAVMERLKTLAPTLEEAELLQKEDGWVREKDLTAIRHRRARAQAQPRGDGGRWVSSGTSMVEMLEHENRQLAETEIALRATIAERDAEIARVNGMRDLVNEMRDYWAGEAARFRDAADNAESELTMAREMVVTRDARLREMESAEELEALYTQLAGVEDVAKHRDRLLIELSAADRSMSEMAGTIADNRRAFERMQAIIATPDLIPMPAMKLGIFIGSFVTMLVIAAGIWVWRLV